MKRLTSHLFVLGCILGSLGSHAWAANLPFGQVVTGTITSAAQSNSYTFSANANDVVDFTIVSTSGTLSPRIELYNSAGTLISAAYGNYPYSCSGGSSVEMNSVKLTTTGTYNVLISDCFDSRAGNYAIYAQRTNNPAGAVQLLLGGQPQTGAISSAAQSNSYTFGASANDVVDFTIVSTSGTLSPRIELYNSAGTLISAAYGNYPYSCSGGSSVEMNNVKLTTTGTYNVLISDCFDSRAGNYAIYAQRTNNPAGAVQLLLGGQPQTGAISSAAQSNSYTFGASANDVVNFTIATTSGTLSPRIELYNSAGTLISAAYGNYPYSCSGGSSVEMNSVKLTTTGTYNVLISDCFDSRAGNYNLSAQCFGVCTAPVFTLNPTFANVSASGATGSVAVTASTATASWTATSNSSWINITAGGSGAGNGTVSYSVAANNSVNSLSGSMTIAGLTFPVTQAGTGSCSIGLSPGAGSVPATGTSAMETCPNNSGQPNCGVTPEALLSFEVTPSASCGVWTATSSNPGVVQVTLGASGSGAGTVDLTVLNNTHTLQQSYAITVESGTTSASYSVTEAGSGDSELYRQVYALYEQLLGRDPDSVGFTFWTNPAIGGVALGQMADDFLTSPEAFNSDFAVMAAYQAATGGPPTYTQFAAAVTIVRGGTQTVTGLFTSLIGSGFTATTMYQNLLNRGPSATELAACADAGLPLCFEALIGFPGTASPISTPNNEFQSTGTFYTTLAADHTNALYIRMLFFVILSRDPDPGGLAFWVGIANDGGPGVLFQGSAGYAARIAILGQGTPNEGFIGSVEFQGLFAN